MPRDRCGNPAIAGGLGSRRPAVGSFPRALRRLALVGVLLGGASPAHAQVVADLQISSYDYDTAPTPVPNGAVALFTVAGGNNGPAAADGAVVTVEISPAFELANAPGTAFPASCTLAGAFPAAQTLSCPIAVLPSGATFAPIQYRATARVVGAPPTRAFITPPTGVTDPNGVDNQLIRNPTVRTGVDLSTTKTPSASSLPAGSPLTYTVVVANAGPDATAGIRVVDNLPPAVDYTWQTATGTNWNCAYSAGGPTVTCDWTGPAQGAGATLPPITITGRLGAVLSGTVTNSAFTLVTAPQVADNTPANDGSGNVIVQVTPGTDLAAVKQMPVGQPPPPPAARIVTGSTVNVLLRIANGGPRQVTGATIVDTFPAGFAIGTLPAGCGRSGQTVTCTAGVLPAGGNADFTIPVTAPATPQSGTNSATVAPPAGVLDPNGANDTVTVPYEVVPPFADLSLTKTKSPNPVSAGAQITSTLTIRNGGVSTLAFAPATPLRVTEQIGPNERWTGVTTAGWACTPAAPVAGPATITCATTGSGTLAVNATTTLVLTSEAVGVPATPPFPTVSNTACTGGTAGSAALPADPDATNDCGSAGTTATTRNADLAIQKEVGPTDAGPWTETYTLPTTAADVYFRLRVRNDGPDAAELVDVRDPIPTFLDASGFLTGVAVVALPSGTTCPSPGAIVNCRMTALAAGEERTIVLRVSRPMNSGTFTNTATVRSPDTNELNVANNEDGAGLTVDPIADLVATQKVVDPDPVQVGVVASYRISFRNRGPNPAENVTLTDTVDLARFEILPGSAATTQAGGSCSIAGPTVSCALGTLQRDQNFQAFFQVRPRFPFAGAPPAPFPVASTNTATLSTTTVQSDTGNDQASVTHDVLAPALDLIVTKTEPPGGDPLAFGDPVRYRITVRNDGPSRATDLSFADVFTVPGGYSASLATFAVDAGASNVVPPAPSCQDGVPSAGTVTCRLGAGAAGSVLDAGQFVTFVLEFAVTGAAPATTQSYSDTVTVRSAESAAGFDANAANDVATETTTVLPRTDLEVVSKARSTSSPVNVNEPVDWSLVVRNNGPSPTTRLRVVDTLPAGFVRTATAVTATPAGAASVTSIACSGATVVTCDLVGDFPAGAGNTVTLALQARAAFPYTGAVGTPLTNSARIEPGRDANGNPVSRDPNPANDTGAETGLVVQGSSLAGRVWADDDRDGALDAGEALGGVTVTVTGTDVYGNALTAVAVTAGSGAWSVANLPPGTYRVVETQPPNTFDGPEVAGLAGGSVPPACPPAANCGTGAAQNTIDGIVLGAAVAATGYDFLDYRAAALRGWVYSDANGDGQRQSGETGVNGTTTPVTLRLTGTDYAGNAVSRDLPLAADGQYSFTNLPPSDAGGYTVTQLNQPAGFLDGLDQNGAGAANVIAGSAGRTPPEPIVVGAVNPGVSLTERSFGELRPATLAGRVYVDADGDARRDPGENAGIPGVTIRLTGTNDLGQAIDCTTTTNGAGDYVFPAAGATGTCAALRPGTYAVAQTPPAGLVVTGAFAGSAGGSGQPPNTPLPGVGVTGVTAITLAAGATATAYDFGVTGQGLSGSVYVDADGDGVRDPGEAGIAGVTVTLSGTTAGGQDVCTAISPSPCTAVTDASGTYRFLDLPASNGAGYTLTEQSQAAPPLNRYADGIDRAGTVNGVPRGTAGNDAIGGVVLAVGELGVGYDFGERAGRLAGSTYLDANDDGVRQPGEPGLAGVTITLSGLTADGVDVCTLLPSCTVVTGSDGGYAFENLPAGTYTLTQTQPAAYADGRETAGTVNGTPSGAPGAPGSSTIGGILVPPGGDGRDYLFGERVTGVAGRVCVDVANDGCGPGDPGLGGVTVTLTGVDAGGAPVNRTVVTDGNGDWRFAELPQPGPGGYTIAQTQPAGYASGPGNTTVGSAGGTAANDAVAGIVPPPGGLATGYGFGELQADLALAKTVSPARARIGETASFTLTLTNAGPTQAPGVAVADPLPAGLQFESAAPSLGAYDATTGRWTVGPLAAGATATLVLTTRVLPGGGYDNVAEVASSGAPDPDSTPGNGAAGEDDRAAATVVALASLTGSVFRDLDGDGVRDPGELPYADVEVQVTDATGAVQVVRTDANGDWRADVPPGATALDVVAPPGTRLTTGNDPQTVTVASAATPTASPPVGYQPLGTLSGTVFSDLNGNGLRDANEPALPNVAVVVGLPTGGTATATTDANGAYSVEVPAGTNVPNVTDPPGTTLTTANDPQSVAVPPGGSGTAAPVGFRPPGPDLILTKTHAPATFTEDNVGTYTLVVRNVGADPTNAPYTVVDALPEGLTVAAPPTGTGWDCAASVVGTRTASCTATAPLVPGAQAPAIVLRVNVAAGSAARSPLVNVATVSGGGELPANGANNEVRDPTPVQRAATVSGSVWLDAGATPRRRDADEPGLGGWLVELIDPSLPPGSPPARTATTDANGAYSIPGVTPGTWRLQFRDPVSGLVWGPPANGEQGAAQPGSRPFPGDERGALELVLAPGASIAQQSLPVDPSGVVYDSVTRQPVAGATVTLRPVGNCPAWDPARDVVGAGRGGYTVAGGGISMTTGANGWYRFVLAPTAPASCEFEYAIVPPANYVAPSALIPPAPPLATPGGAGSFAVQPQPTAPRVGQGTTYHLRLTLGSSLATVTRNHLPLDPAVPSTIVVEKVASTGSVELGDSLAYTVRVRNVRGPTLPVVTIADSLPAGFRYVAGTARARLGTGTVVVLADPAGGAGPRLTFAWDAPLPSGQVLELSYRVRVGIGGLQGDGVNRARAASGAVGSNLAEARVRVTGGAFTTEACVVGKVYADCNENRVQDAEEVGIPGVRLYFETGTWLVSDSEGRYSLCGLKPRTHVLKVDPRTLPVGASLDTVDNRNAGDPGSRFVDLRNGELHRADFHVRGCPVDVMGQIEARRTQGEVGATELERAGQASFSLDPLRDTQCAAPRHANDPAYRDSADDCANPPPATNAPLTRSPAAPRPEDPR